MSKWQDAWNKAESEVITFEVGEKVWWGYPTHKCNYTPGIIREVREDEEPGSVRKYRVQLPTVTVNASGNELKKVEEEEL